MKTFTYAPKGRPRFPYYLFLAALMMASPLWSQEAVTLDEALAQMAALLSTQLRGGSVVAILNIRAPSANLSSYIIDDLTSNITTSRKLVVVERQSIQMLQSELQFQMSGDVSDETAQRIGHMIGAQFIISGSITQIGPEYSLTIRAVNVETARVVFQPRALAVQPDAKLAGLLNARYDEFTTGRRVGASFLNLAAGLGSYTMGDWGGGLAVTAAMGAAAGLLVWELSLTRDDPLFGVPGTVALGVAGAGIIFGIIRPLVYNKNTSSRLVAAPFLPSVAIVPVADNSGIKSVQLLCNWQF